MTSNLEREIAKLKQGDHICLIFETTAEQLATAVRFIIDGLARGERCLSIADDRSNADVVQAIAVAGVDVLQERQRGALRLLTWQDTYLRAGEFLPQAMIGFVRQAETEALQDGASGLRLTGEMSWVLATKSGRDRFIEYEAFINNLLRNSKSMVLCQYARSLFDAPCIHDVLRTHPLAILGDQICPNPYYETPEMVVSDDQAVTTPAFKAKRVDWWIAQLKRMQADGERALEKLRQSERRLAEAQQVAHIGSWERDLRTNEVNWSDELYRLFGLPAHEGNITYQEFLNRLLPEDADRIHALAEEAIRERGPFNCDYRITLADGSVRVVNDRGNIILSEEGKPIRVVGTAQDVTELRLAEQALQGYAARLQTLSRRLLEVQEQERGHLARELHDEVGQLLTGLRLQLRAGGDLSADAVDDRFVQARGIVDELLERVRGLSFDLRPAALDQLGLMHALLALFERYTSQTGVLVSFKHTTLDGRFATDVETTAYRVVQEALTNVARHAVVTDVTVRVWATADLLGVQIEDRGRGFDPEAALATPRSSGLAGMQERVTLLEGSLTVESRPGYGTQITAELPLTR
jgi:PAS domain S-box-containing protein